MVKVLLILGKRILSIYNNALGEVILISVGIILH